ncbi:ABC transporter substrate-binding protein [Insolitispirillum peregrinum]|uniref:ABC transporter substrate-binding protein n=1 Tax=Insolitispirillum peregrinum TaxID=80876 RepID=UPI0036175C26
MLPLSRTVIATALATACLAGAPLRAQAERVVLGASAASADAMVGCVYPMTGRAAIYGLDSVEGIRLALADLDQEAAVGLPVPRLGVLVDDALSKASYALRIAEGYINDDHVRFLCGEVSSGVASALSDLARRRQIIMVGTDHASSRMTIEGKHPYYFRVSNDSWISNAAGARYLRDIRAEQPWQKIAFLNPDYDYGHVSRDDFLAALDGLGESYEVVGEFWPKLYEPDYSAYIEALKEAKPDIVITALWGGDFIEFIKQARAANLFPHMRVANFDTGANYDVLVALGDTPPPGLILSARHHNTWPQSGYNRRFVERFHAQTGRYPTYAAEGAYSGIMAIARVLGKTGVKAPNEQVIAAFEQLQIALPEDPDGYTSHIDPDTHQMVQAQAIGTPVPNHDFPPAKVMLGNIRVYDAESLRPPRELIDRRRAAVRGSPTFNDYPTP